MPELPEVETIRRGLEARIVEKKIADVEVLNEKSFIGDSSQLVGREVISLRRRGKGMIVDFSGGISLLIHLKMTGQLVFEGSERFGGGHPTEDFVNDLPSKQTRVIFVFEDGSRLFFNDQRKFGYVKLLDTAGVMDDKFVASLGPEPWDEVLDKDGLFERLARHGGMTIKGALLDQAVIAGVGNIYADEALFFAGVHPARRVSTVSRAEAKKILEGVRKTMEKSIEEGGSTMTNYVKADGTRGNYLDLFAQVFRREGKECLRCGAIIEKTRVAGRGTHVCPKCQVLK
jgi:formamidopyrimidine-DNA glycosylase